MRYNELFERDYGKIMASLQAMIDHPSTEPELRDAAQRKLNALLSKGDAEKQAKAQAAKDAEEKAKADHKAEVARQQAEVSGRKREREASLAAKDKRDLDRRRADARAREEDEAIQASYRARKSAADLRNVKPTGKFVPPSF